MLSFERETWYNEGRKRLPFAVLIHPMALAQLRCANMNSLPRTSGIYKIVCIPTGKIYVGSAVNIRTRWYKHANALENGKHENQKLQRAWHKYGSVAFDIEILEFVMPWARLDREQYWLDKLTPFGDRGFNIMTLARGGSAGEKTPETRALISAKLKGNTNAKGHKPTPEQLHNQSLAHKGHKHSPEHKAKISAGLLRAGRKQNEKTRQALTRATSKEYIVTSPNGVEARITNLAQYCRDNGIEPNNLYQVALGKRPHHKGWTCRYA